MRIVFARGTPPGVLLNAVEALREAVEASRFVVLPARHCSLGIYLATAQVIHVGRTRLRTRKPYCGSHPAGCEPNAFREERRPTCAILEGADWIGFNDLVNDTLDRLGLECRAYTDTVVIREWRGRRVRYGDRPGQFTRVRFWDRAGVPQDYQDYRGKQPPVTRFPEGTPGIASYQPGADARGSTCPLRGEP